MRQIGVFCGTFNPIHLGHLQIAESAREQFSLEIILFVTSPQPPHRESDLLCAEDRHKMVIAATADNPHFEASDLELNRQGPSYTIDTIKQIKELFGHSAEINFLIGGDNLPLIGKWHQAEELMDSCKILVAPRLELFPQNKPTKKNGQIIIYAKRVPEEQSCLADEFNLEDRSKIFVIDFPGVAISSSLIRQQLAKGHSVRYMVPSSVNAILVEKKHYR